jgi:signal transduction histidine kinase
MEVCFNPRGTDKTIWVSASAAPIRTADGRQIGSVATFIDITDCKQAERELKQMLNQIEQERRQLEERVRERTAELEKTYASLERREEELRYLSSKLLSAHEEERKRIAREIHDSLGASLSAIKMKIESTLQRLEQDVPPVVARTFEALLPVVKEGLDESRRIQTDLRPAILDDIGILSTIAWFCKRFEANSGIRVDQEIKIREEDVPDRLKIVIYRIIQEAMNNIGKYSKADLVVIAFQEIGNRIELVIRDNGRGFDPEEVLSRESTRRGLGLSSMKERAELSGGLFEIETGQGRGTTVRASWPIS